MVGPPITIFTKLDSDESRVENSVCEAGEMRSFKCWGSRPSCPPADPEGKDLMAFKTTVNGTIRGVSGV